MGGLGGLTRFLANSKNRVGRAGGSGRCLRVMSLRLTSIVVGRGGVYRGEVAFAGVDMQFVAVFFGGNVDGTILAVAFEESGFVGDEIAAADDLLQIGKASVEAVNRAGDEGGSA